jgi:hypothetical protein
MSRGRLRTGVLSCLVWGLACEGPEKVYFEVPSAAAGGSLGEPVAPAATSHAGGVAPESSGGAAIAGASTQSSSREPASGGAPASSAGTSASTGGAAPAAGGAGAPPEPGAPAKQAAACAEYIVTQCRRLGECWDEPYEQCLTGAIQLCPERFFLPGSRVTVEAVEGCSERWRQSSCEDLRAERYPRCEFAPGERKLGAACMFSTQCEVGACGTTRIGECARCIPIVSSGEACGPEVAICGGGLACLETGTCGPRVPAPALGVGAACSNALECEAGLMCAADASGARSCRAKIVLGDPCGVTSECLDGYCDDDTKICMVVPGLRMPCALDGRHPDRSCAGGSVCDAHVDPPLCVTAGARGQACYVNPKLTNGSTCQPGLFCECTDETCAARQCKQRVGPGEDCSFAASCLEGSECRGGRCGALPPQPEDTMDCGS